MAKNLGKPVRRRLRLAIQMLVLVVAALVLVPEFRRLLANIGSLSGISVTWLAAGFSVFCLSFVFAAIVYKFICSQQLSLKHLILVQFATAFTNRLLPSGMGGMGTNAAFLTKSGLDKPSAVSLLVLNSVMGFFMFSLILVTTGGFTLTNTGLDRSVPPPILWSVVFLAVLVALFILTFNRAKVVILAAAGRFITSFLSVAKQPRRLAGAALASGLITACYITALYCCLAATGVSLLPVNQVIMVFAVGAAATAISPTPGGLGAGEVAMLASLSQLGVASTPALAAVIAYRLISFWLPIIPGYLSFRYITNKKYI